MAGILDDVIDGITEKEKEAGNKPATPPPAPAAKPEQAPPTPPANDKPMNVYHDDFKKKYGDKK
ncbi:MAG: hypothetical protein LBB81_01350 [Treponema sp.]|jgi:hypothetical protein|nr:hypothetical protein [Treponema sp.]